MGYKSVIKCKNCDYLFLGDFQKCPKCGSSEIFTSTNQNDIDSMNTEYSKNIWGKSVIISIVTITILIIIVLLMNSCNLNSGNKQENYQSNHHLSNQNYQNSKGKYSYKDNSIELEITIIGDSWTGKTKFITGFSSDYDNQNASYENGVIKGNNLFDSSGTIIVGNVSGNYLNTSIGGKSVLLKK